MVGQPNKLLTVFTLELILILHGSLQYMDAIINIHLRDEIQFPLLGPHDHRAAVIPKIFGGPLVASSLRKGVTTSRAIDQRNLRQQIICSKMDFLDVDFGSVSRDKGWDIDKLFIHIIFLKIALLYIILIVGIP